MCIYLEKEGESITLGCRILGKSRQAYYKQQKAKVKKLDVASEVISLVDNIRIQMPRIGTRKLHYLLASDLESLGVGRDKFFHILKANQRLIVPKRCYRVTTNSHHRFRKHKDIVSETLINRPEQVWVSDITYIGSRGRHSYLALVTDAYSKKIIGYDLSNSLCSEGAERALEMALKRRIYKATLIHHSDRGLQYCSNSYQSILKLNKVKVSMTEKYDPYANAIAERVNGILKQEFLLEEYICTTDVLKVIVKESIDVYNNKRPHLSCAMLTPNQMHLQCKLVKPNYGQKTKSTIGVNPNC